MKKSAFEKRVKRRVSARTHRFFAVCVPGLKRLCHRELVDLPLNLQDIEMISGGVEFTGTIHDCYAANLFLRSPSRIIMRIAGFKAENFRTLEKKLALIEWELFLKKSSTIKCEVSTTHSRLYHKDAIAQRVQQSLMGYFERFSSSDCMTGTPAQQTLMIRGEDDNFEISLDSSGDLLHKRSIKKHVGAAPLRETLAFAILNAAGYSGEGTVIDGMCGSGSFALEAAMMAGYIPPGYFRDFAFEHWPCFTKAQWNHLKKEISQEIRQFAAPSIFAMDQDAGMVGHLEEVINEVKLLSSIMVMKQDFFALKPDDLTSNKGIVVLNPPFGKRIGETKNRDDLFRKIAGKLSTDFKGWKAGIILPEKALMNCFSGPGSVGASGSLIPLFHGGLELHGAILQF